MATDEVPVVECACWVDNDPDEGFIDMRGCPIHDRDEEGDAEAYAWWMSQQ